MENEAVDLNPFIKVEIFTKDEVNDSIFESQITKIELEADPAFEPDMGLVKVESAHDDLFEESTGSNENDCYENESVKNCEQTLQPTFLAFKEEQNSDYEDAFEIPHSCNTENPPIPLIDAHTSLSGMGTNVYSCVKSNEEHMKNSEGEMEEETSVKEPSDKEFQTEIRIKQHTQFPIKRKYHICEFCNKTFLHESDLNRHISIHTGIKPYSCTFCGKCFRLAFHLRVHQRVHSVEKPFTCRECPKSFKSQWSLKVHENVHMQTLPFSCDRCARSFTRKDRLKDHIAQIHITDKPFICTICSRSFSTRSAARGHRKIHTSEGTFVCDICKKTYTARYKFLSHLKCHNPKSYLCTYCMKRFSLRQSFKRHLLIHKKE